MWFPGILVVGRPMYLQVRYLIAWFVKGVFAYVAPLLIVGGLIMFFEKDDMYKILSDYSRNDYSGRVILRFTFVVCTVQLGIAIMDLFYLNALLRVRDLFRACPALPLVQALLLLGSNTFTLTEVPCSHNSVYLLGFLVMGFLSLEASIDAHDLNLSTAMLSVMMSMACSCGVSDGLEKGWRLVVGALLYAMMIFYLTGKLYIPAPRHAPPPPPADNGAGDGGNGGGNGNRNGRGNGRRGNGSANGRGRGNGVGNGGGGPESGNNGRGNGSNGAARRRGGGNHDN